MVWLGRSVAALAVTFVLGTAPVQAQTNYPERAVKIIVPIGPGGSYDLVGRAAGRRALEAHGAILLC